MRKSLIHPPNRVFFDQLVTSFAPSLVTKIVTGVTIYISLQVHRYFPVLGKKHAAKIPVSGRARNFRTLHLGK